MTERKKFNANVAIQIGGFFVMLAGGALVEIGGLYFFNNILHLSPVMTVGETPLISIAPLILKIIVLVIFLALLVLAIFRGNKTRKAVFNDYTGANLRHFLLYSFLQGALLFLYSGFAYYTLISTLTGANP